jgi:hypothetical protein
MFIGGEPPSEIHKRKRTVSGKLAAKPPIPCQLVITGRASAVGVPERTMIKGKSAIFLLGLFSRRFRV